ncbi:MAG: hypothetical protein ABI612_16070 [Betaproteobacteria bacterium]
MLDTLDILIGFTLIMLIVSMAVTMLTQLISSQLLNLRGKALKTGIARLLALLDRGLTPTDAQSIADHILRNPMIGQPALTQNKYRLGAAVHREELVKLILDFAAEGDAEKADQQATAGESTLRAKVLKSLKGNGIDNPAEVLTQIRNALVELEKTSPELSHSARLNIAILHFASSDFLSKLNSWFDQTVDRVSDVFTVRVRVVTACVALVVAFVLGLDSIDLINRLSVDKNLRNQLVAAAIRDSEKLDPARQAVPAPVDGKSQGEPPAISAALDKIEGAGFSDLRSLGVITLPRSPQEWYGKWTEGGEGTWVRRLFGILLSAALLSLGAPFWYAALRDLLKLRSVTERKDDVLRAERQTTQPSPAAAATTLPSQFRGGEAGDLEAKG